MTTVQILPPKSRDQSNKLDYDNTMKNIIELILEKIQNGNEEVTQEDLQALQVMLGDHANSQLPPTNVSVPFLNRQYLKSSTSNTSPTIVRFTGMVQDMLDPEYFVNKIDGKFTKYCETVVPEKKDNKKKMMCTMATTETSMMMDNHNLMLEERHPLIVVPLPFCSTWFKDALIKGEIEVEEDSMKLNTETSTRENNERKRVRDSCNDDMDTDMEEEDSLEIIGQPSRKMQTRQLNSVSMSEEENSERSTEVSGKSKEKGCEWWPQGCMSSDPEQSPVLAKVYYDQQQDQQRLKLNDVVEIFGIVYANDDLEKQSTHGQMESCDMYMMNGEEEIELFRDFDNAMTFPPPSILPRVHVLHYRKKNLDTIMNGLAKKVVLDSDEKKNNIVDDRTLCINTFASYIFDGDKAAAEVLLMSLMSMAERGDPSFQKTIQLPSGTTLGCASLNFISPDVASCDILRRRVCSVLNTIVPVNAMCNLSLPALNGSSARSASLTQGQNVHHLSFPMKSGRLGASVMQLPKGSCFVLDECQLTPGTLSSNGLRTIDVLSKMTQNHAIPYRFEGGIDIDFECDYRIIVFSSSSSHGNAEDMDEKNPSSSNKLLPCSLSVHVKSVKPFVSSGTSGLEDHHIPQDTITRIRRYIAKCRGKELTNIPLTKEVLNVAERDFVDRRKSNRHSHTSSRETTELDFHRWLTLTRLQARSRFGAFCTDDDQSCTMTATKEDWKASLLLDDLLKSN